MKEHKGEGESRGGKRKKIKRLLVDSRDKLFIPEDKFSDKTVGLRKLLTSNGIFMSRENRATGNAVIPVILLFSINISLC